eukprot:gene25042-10900_t
MGSNRSSRTRSAGSSRSPSRSFRQVDEVTPGPPNVNGSCALSAAVTVLRETMPREMIQAMPEEPIPLGTTKEDLVSILGWERWRDMRVSTRICRRCHICLRREKRSVQEEAPAYRPP